MKFSITLKTPDCVEDAIRRTTDDEAEIREALKISEKWFSFGELVTLTIDTELKSCEVEES